VPWKQIPAVDTTSNKGHRVETRTLKLVEIPAGMAFPHAALTIQITRTRRPFARSRVSRETVYGVTDLTYDNTTTTELANAIRGHWSIENRLDWIRDVAFAEDHSQVRTGHGPQVMATFRNLAVSLHRLHGAATIAAACRRISRDADPDPVSVPVLSCPSSDNGPINNAGSLTGHRTAKYTNARLTLAGKWVSHRRMQLSLSNLVAGSATRVRRPAPSPWPVQLDPSQTSAVREFPAANSTGWIYTLCAP